MAEAKLAKVLKEKGELLTTKKLYDNQLPEWTTELVQIEGIIPSSQRPCHCLVDHIGNDLGEDRQ